MHLCAPSPQRTPVLYQAGSSGRGRRFAATHAECVFVNRQDKAAVKAIVDDIRAQAVQLGRAADDVKVFMGTTLVLGRTEQEARDKFEDYRRYVSSEAALVHAAASLGIDFAKYDLDEPIDGSKSQAIVSNVEAMTRRAGPQWTRRMLLEQMVLGSRQAPLIGSAESIADALIDWVRGHRHRRLQPVAHGRARVHRRCDRVAGAGAAGARRLQDCRTATAPIAKNCSVAPGCRLAYGGAISRRRTGTGCQVAPKPVSRTFLGTFCIPGHPMDDQGDWP